MKIFWKLNREDAQRNVWEAFRELSKKTVVQYLMRSLFFCYQNHVVESHFKVNVQSEDRRNIIFKQKAFSWYCYSKCKSPLYTALSALRQFKLFVFDRFSHLLVRKLVATLNRKCLCTQETLLFQDNFLEI